MNVPALPEPPGSFFVGLQSEPIVVRILVVLNILLSSLLKMRSSRPQLNSADAVCSAKKLCSQLPYCCSRK